MEKDILPHKNGAIIVIITESVGPTYMTQLFSMGEKKGRRHCTGLYVQFQLGEIKCESAKT